MATIFLSHSTKDKKAAQQLKAWLEDTERGHQVFLDDDIQTGIKAGANWEQALYVQLRTCRVFLPILTQNWIDSKWCFAEMTHARAQGKLILPVKLNPKLDTSNLFSDLQHTPIDLSGDDQNGYQRLQRALQEEFPWNPERSPYPGLLAFQEEDAAIYHGRGPEIISAIELLEGLRRRGQSAPHFVLLLGASGSGKSSLVRAGITPRLRFKNEWLQLNPFMPRTNPITELAEAFARTFKDIPALKSKWSVDKLEQKLALAAKTTPPDGKSLLGLVRDLRTQNQDNATLLLVIDQAEELFSVSDLQQTEQFLGLLRAAIEQSEGRLMVLATMRSEFLDRFQQHPFLIDSHYTRPFEYETFTLDPLPIDRFRDIIRKPAELVGLEIESDLVEQMINDTGTRDALPLLAYTLRRMWDNEKFREDGRLDLNEYQELGGLEGSVHKAADEALNLSRRSKEELAALKEAFVPAMVKLTHEDEPVRQRTRRDQLTSGASDLLEPFINNRLLITDQSADGHETLEVAHEALLRVWSQLADWINEDRDKLHQFESLERAAKDWDNHNQQPDLLVHKNHRLKELLELVRSPRFQLREDAVENAYLLVCEHTQHTYEAAEKAQQQQEIRSFRKRLAIACVLLVVAIGSAIYAFDKSNEAQKQTEIAEAHATEAKAALMWNNFYSNDNEISPIEIETLWELAASEEAVRDAFVERLLYDKENSERFATISHEVTRALVAFDAEYRQKIIQSYLTPLENQEKNRIDLLGASFLAIELVAVEGISFLVEAIQRTEHDQQLEALGNSLEVFAAKIDSGSVQRVVTSLVTAIEKTEYALQIDALVSGLATLDVEIDADSVQRVVASLVTAIEKTKDYEQLKALVGGLVTLKAKIDSESAQRVVASLVIAIEKTEEVWQLVALVSGVVALDAVIDANSTQRVVASLVATIEKTGYLTQIDALGNGLVALAKKIGAKSAQRVVVSLVTAIEKTEDQKQLEALGNSLEAFAAKIDAESAQRVVASLVTAIEKTEEGWQLAALISSLVPLAAEIDANSVQRVVASLVTAIEKTEDKSLIALRTMSEPQFAGRRINAKWLFEALGNALVVLSAMIDANSAQGVVASLVTAIEETKDGWQLEAALVSVLVVLDAEIDSESVQRVVASLVIAIEKTEDKRQLKALENGLVAFAAKIDAESAQRVVESLMTAIEKTEDGWQHKALRNGLVAFAAKIDAESAQRVVPSLVIAIEKSEDEWQLAALASGLVMLDAEIDAKSTQRVVASLMASIEKTENGEQLAALVSGLVALDSEIDAKSTQEVVISLVAAIEKTKYSELLATLRNSLVAFAVKIDAESVQGAVASLVASIEKTENGRQLEALISGLVALDTEIEAESVQGVVAPLLTAIEETQYLRKKEALGNGLAALTAKIDAESAQVAVAFLVANIEKTENRWQLEALERALVSLVEKIPVDGAQKLVFNLLLSTRTNARNNDVTQHIESSLKAVALKLPASESSVRLIFKALTNPMITLETEEALLNILQSYLSVEPVDEPIDLWKLVEHAKEKFPNVDFSSRDYAKEVLENRKAYASKK